MLAINTKNKVTQKARRADTRFILLLLLALPVCQLGQANAYTIEVVDRTLYGPGPFPDQKLKSAWIRNIQLEGFLNGKSNGVNNLGEEPNVSGEILQGKEVDGKLSDATLINEDIDMSNAVIMNGQFNLLLAAVFGGPNNGNTFFYLDEHYNWWIRDDIAIDPGFAAGIVRIDNFTFSTGPRIIPTSLQTELNYPGGTNKIGSTEAGRIALGRLGDENEDGFIDGIFNAIGRFPLNSIFLPGAPFVQIFEFKSDIPITPAQSALLTIASARNNLSLFNDVKISNSKHQDLAALWQQTELAIKKASSHIKAAADKDCGKSCSILKRLSEQVTKISMGDKQSVEKSIDEIYLALKSIIEHDKG